MTTFRKMLHSVRDERGFTLVELLMVMVIIGVLAGIGFAGMGMLQQRTLVTKADTYWRTLDSAVSMYVISGNKVDESTNLQDLEEFIDIDEEPWDDNPEGAKDNAWNGTICLVPEGKSDGTYYCIEDRGKVSVWVVEGSRTAGSTHNYHEKLETGTGTETED